MSIAMERRCHTLKSMPRLSRVLLIGAGCLVILSVAAFIGIEATSTTKFCRSCHVMETAYGSLSHSTHRDAVHSCGDCHLPNGDFGSLLVYKSTSGVRHLYENFIVGPPADLHATSATKDIVMENCLRCHGDMVANVNIGGRRCQDCHRSIPHSQMLKGG